MAKETKQNSMEELENLRDIVAKQDGEIKLYGELALRVINALLDYTQELKTQREWSNDLYYKKQAEIELLSKELQESKRDYEVMAQVIGNKN